MLHVCCIKQTIMEYRKHKNFRVVENFVFFMGYVQQRKLVQHMDRAGY